MFETQRGYDVIASVFERWHWFLYWRRNETPFVQEWLSQQPAGVGLDVGAGTGPYRDLVARLRSVHVMLDLSREMLRVHSDGRRLRVQGDVRRSPFADRTFDWVLCTRVLSHVRDPVIAFDEILRVMKPGARCLVTDVHEDHPYQLMAVSKDGRLVEIETYRHSTAEIESAARRAGFLVLSTRGVRASELEWRPPIQGFERLHRNRGAVLYLCQVCRPPVVA